jgi:aldose 1-epimerase
MTDTTNNKVELHAGALRLAVRPDLGGSIAGLWHGSTPLMRSTEPGELAAARQSASFPMVPYSNRLGHRRFRWHGRDHATAANFEGSPHSLHGVGWMKAWQVEAFSPSEIVLHYRHRPDEHWPFAFEVRQHFTLTPRQMGVRMVMTSTDTSAQPAGLGWHPYFPKRTRSHLDVAVTERWDTDATLLPTHKVAQPGIAGDIARLAFDHCFEGWTGPAHIRDDRFALQLSSSLDRLVVYTPHDKPYFCVEPVSHVNNAIHLADPLKHGIVDLQPGQSTEAWMKLEVSPL